MKFTFSTLQPIQLFNPPDGGPTSLQHIAPTLLVKLPCRRPGVRVSLAASIQARRASECVKKGHRVLLPRDLAAPSTGEFKPSTSSHPIAPTRRHKTHSLARRACMTSETHTRIAIARLSFSAEGAAPGVRVPLAASIQARRASECVKKSHRVLLPRDSAAPSTKDAGTCWFRLLKMEMAMGNDAEVESLVRQQVAGSSRPIDWQEWAEWVPPYLVNIARFLALSGD